MAEIYCECDKCGSLHLPGHQTIDLALDRAQAQLAAINSLLESATRIEFAGITNQRILVSLVEGRWSIQEAADGYGVKIIASFSSAAEAFEKLKEIENDD